MTRRLTFLNVVILLLLAAVCQMIWKRAHDASIARGLLRAPLEKTKTSLPKSLLAFSPLQSSAYLGIAEGNLLSPDRNPNVTVEEPLAKVSSPPPLPLLSGFVLMDGLPPTVLLSAQSGPGRRAFHIGDTIGNWQIDSFDSRQIVLEWQGERVTKPLAELIDHSTNKAQILSVPKDKNATSTLQPVPPQSVGNSPDNQVNASKGSPE
jgi:hypothetical protein